VISAARVSLLKGAWTTTSFLIQGINLMTALFVANGLYQNKVQARRSGMKNDICVVPNLRFDCCSFKTPRLLAKHVTLHSGIKPHQCDVCGKQFREKGALREHSRIHTGAMPYACDYCGKRFRFKGILTVSKMRASSSVARYRDFTNF